MCSLERFKIDLKGLKTEQTMLEFDLDDDFFKSLGATEVDGGTLHVSVSIRKATGFFELHFHTEGTVTIPCDRCLDAMQQPITADHTAVVKLGNTASDDGDEVIVVDETEGTLDTSWLIYEYVALSIPIQHVHQPGDCNVEMMEKLTELSAARSSVDADSPATDPRWSKLSELIINN